MEVTEMRFPRALRVAIAPAIFVVACNGDGGTTPSPMEPADTSPPSASYSVSETGDSILGFSPSPSHLFRLRIPVRIRETAGLGGHINYARLQFFLNGQPTERNEMTSSRIRAKAGTNRVEASSFLDIALDFDFNTSDFDDLVLTFDLRDDKGNSHNFEYIPTGNLVVLLDVLELTPGAFQSSPRRR